LGIIFALYNTQLRHSSIQSKIAETELELMGTLSLLKRDIFEAGFGLPQEIKPVDGINSSNSYDTLILRGSILQLNKTGEAYSYLVSNPVNLNQIKIRKWDEGTENILENYWVIFIDPFTKSIISNNNAVNSLYRVQSYSDSIENGTPVRTLTISQSLDDGLGNNILFEGTLVYSLSNKTQPPSQIYSEIHYYLSQSDSDASCAPGTYDLIREEKYSDGGIQTTLSCVADFQISYGFKNLQGEIEWKNDISAYSSEDIRENLKLLRVNLLFQVGKKDYKFSYPNNSETLEDHKYSFTSEQKNYRWRTIKIELKPRNFL